MHQPDKTNTRTCRVTIFWHIITPTNKTNKDKIGIMNEMDQNTWLGFSKEKKWLSLISVDRLGK